MGALKKHTNLRHIIVFAIVLCIGSMIIDYFDVFSRLGLNPSTLNLEAENIFVTAITAISLFLSAYYLVDQWEKKQYDNKREIALQLIRASYQECIKYTELLDKSIDGDILVEVKKGNIDAKGGLMKYYSEYENNPFLNHEYIMQFCTDGIIEAKEIQEYLKIFYLYKGYITIYVTLRDSGKTQFVNAMRDELLTRLKDATESKKGME